MANSSEGGNKVGILGAGVLAVGAMCARLADDCARVGVHSASLVDDGARGLARGGSLADDGARNLGRGGSLADDGARNLGHTGQLADDAALGGGLGRPSIYGPPPAVAEDSARLVEVTRGGDVVVDGSSLDVAKVALDISLDVVPNLAGDGPRARTTGTRPSAQRLTPHTVTDHPLLLSLLPATTKAYEFVYGKPARPRALKALVDTAGALPEPGSAAKNFLYTFLDAHVARNPIGIVAYAHGDLDVDGAMVAVLPDGERLEDARLHLACLQRGDSCVLLICPPEPDEPGACARAARQLWDTTVQAHPEGDEPMSLFLARLFDARDADPDARTIIVSRVTSDASGALHLVRSKVREQHTQPRAER